MKNRGEADLSDVNALRAPSKRSPGSLRLHALGVTLVYAGMATLWILFSDRGMGAVIRDPELLIRLSVYKGMAFVAVTSLLLFLLTRHFFAAMENGYRALQTHQVEIERMNRLYAALTRVNQAIVRNLNRHELFQKVCQELMENSGMCLVWIGWLDPVTLNVVPVADGGDPEGYLQGFKIPVGSPSEELGPTGLAFRDHRDIVINQMRDGLTADPRRREIERRSMQSCAAFPIRVEDRVMGTLSVYSTVSGFFQDKEIALLREVVGDMSFALDNLVEKEKRLEVERIANNERHFSATMIESMPGILYFYNEKGEFLRWNRNFETVSGYSGSEIARMHPLDFFSEEEKGLLRQKVSEVFANGEGSEEATFISKDGKQTPMYFTGRKVEFEGEPCLVGVGVDISLRKRAEAALRELNASLEGKVAERTVELQEALVRAEAADRIKSAFLATMSHELRTPLNSIIGFTGIVLQGLPGPLTDEQRKQLGMVKNSARHLLDLINDVLDISKIEAGQLEVRAEAFVLRDALETVMALVKPQADAKGLALSAVFAPELPAEMVSDPRRVQQILLNLVNNAIKFTDRGGVTVTVDTLDADVEIPASLRIRVADTGIGIRQEDLETLFQPFRQIETGLSRQHEGTGLGLAICRRLAELMGGKISAASEPAKGSEFCVILPLQRGEHP